MRFVKSLTLLLLSVLLIITGILFSKRNIQQVELDLLVVKLPIASLAIYVLTSFLIGALLAGFIFTIANFQTKIRNRLLQRKRAFLLKNYDVHSDISD